MKHVGVRSTRALDSWVENKIAALEPAVQIDEAKVQLICGWHDSPPFSVRIHLVTPGPDFFAQAQDHTLRAAVDKAMKEVRTKIIQRSAKKMQKARSNLSAPAEVVRGIYGR